MSSTDVPIRASKTAAELLAALNKALRAHRECQGIQVSKLVPLSNAQDGLANWDAEFTAKPGTTMSAESKRIALSAKLSVQKHFDLAGA